MNKNRIIIYLAGFLFSLPIALMAYVNSSFLSLFVGSKLMGITYTVSSAFSILAMLAAPEIWRRVGGYKFLLSAILLDALTILSFAMAPNSFLVILAFIFGFALNIVIVFALDEFLKIFSSNSATGRTRGTYIAVVNLAWILSQLILIPVKVEGAFPFQTLYLISFFIMLLFFLLCLFALRHTVDPKYDRTKLVKYLKDFFQNKNLRRAYGLNLLLQIFYIVMVIYTPIYLSLHLGFGWRSIGIIFAIMLLPFSIFPFFEGIYSDRVGERKMLMLGFLITGTATIALFFIQSREVWVWALALFMTRVGAATIEVMSDAYFFKHIKPENEEYIGVYRGAPPVAYVLGPLAALFIFTFVPSFNFIYLILGALMLYGVYLTSTIKRSDS